MKSNSWYKNKEIRREIEKSELEKKARLEKKKGKKDELDKKLERRKKQRTIIDMMKRLPQKEREAIEIEENKVKRLDLQEIKQNLWRKWRGRKDQGEKDEKNYDQEIRMKTDKITNILANVEEEKKMKVKREKEWKERRKRMIEIGREKQADTEKKNRDRKERLKKKSELDGTWEMLKWVTRTGTDGKMKIKKENEREG